MLKCEACGHETEGLTCAACSKENPPDAAFCCYCGSSLGPAQAYAAAGGEGDPYDLENRILCSDENCIGIIENGVCTECGKPYNP